MNLSMLRLILSGLHTAWCYALGPESTARANNLLYLLSLDRHCTDDEASVYRELVNCTEGLWDRAAALPVNYDFIDRLIAAPAASEARH